jgi:hypothetical protein
MEQTLRRPNVDEVRNSFGEGKEQTGSRNAGAPRGFSGKV